MAWVVLTASALFIVGLGVGSTIRSRSALLYPVIVAVVLVVLVLAGSLFGQDEEFGRFGIIIMSSIWTVLPALVGTLIGIGGKAIESRD